MKIINATRQEIICENAAVAKDAVSRSVGLLNRKSLNANEGLVIERCQCIHMFFMRFAIDAIFIDGNNRVVGLVKNIRPFCVSPIFFKAHYVIELPVGRIASSKTMLGDVVEMKE